MSAGTAAQGRRQHCSSATAEAALLRAGGGQGRVLAVENGIDTVRLRSGCEVRTPGRQPGSALVVFTGQMDYRPNIDAVIWLRARRLARDPGAASHRALRDCRPRADARRCRALAGEGVIVTGEVPDVRGLARRRRGLSSRRSSSRAVCRTRCSRRWRWPGRWSLRLCCRRGNRPRRGDPSWRRMRRGSLPRSSALLGGADARRRTASRLLAARAQVTARGMAGTRGWRRLTPTCWRACTAARRAA